MRVANSLRIVQPDRWDERPARLALMDDEGSEMDSINLVDLAKALAPLLSGKIQIKEIDS